MFLKKEEVRASPEELVWFGSMATGCSSCTHYLVSDCKKSDHFFGAPLKERLSGGSQGGLPPSPRLHENFALIEHKKDAKSNICTLGKLQTRIIANGILYQHFHKTFVNIQLTMCGFMVNFSWHWELLDQIYAGTESVKATVTMVKHENSFRMTF